MSAAARTVVVGPYPTMGGPEARVTQQRVRDLLAQGREVLVVSPRPSAAHLHADPGSPRGAARLAALLDSSDELVVRLDASGLATGSDSPALLPARLALAGAFTRPSRVELTLDRVPPSVSSRWVRLVAGRADLVVVATDGERDALAAAGMSPSSVVVDARISLPPQRAITAPAGPIVADRGAEGRARSTPTGATAAELEVLVRHRARAAQTPAERAGGPGAAAPSSKPLRSIPPLERPAIRSKNPAYVAVKKAQLKVLAWMFDWVIQHVNRLQQATIESLELAATDRTGGADRERQVEGGGPSAAAPNNTP